MTTWPSNKCDGLRLLTLFRPESKIYLGRLFRPESKIYRWHLFIHYWLFWNYFSEHL